jgi:hypothetical protein
MNEKVKDKASIRNSMVVSTMRLLPILYGAIILVQAAAVETDSVSSSKRTEHDLPSPPPLVQEWEREAQIQARLLDLVPPVKYNNNHAYIPTAFQAFRKEFLEAFHPAEFQTASQSSGGGSVYDNNEYSPSEMLQEDQRKRLEQTLREQWEKNVDGLQSRYHEAELEKRARANEQQETYRAREAEFKQALQQVRLVAASEPEAPAATGHCYGLSNGPG